MMTVMAMKKISLSAHVSQNKFISMSETLLPLNFQLMFIDILKPNLPLFVKHLNNENN